MGQLYKGLITCEQNILRDRKNYAQETFISK